MKHHAVGGWHFERYSGGVRVSHESPPVLESDEIEEDVSFFMDRETWVSIVTLMCTNGNWGEPFEEVWNLFEYGKANPKS